MRSFDLVWKGHRTICVSCEMGQRRKPCINLLVYCSLPDWEVSLLIGRHTYFILTAGEGRSSPDPNPDRNGIASLQSILCSDFSILCVRGGLMPVTLNWECMGFFLIKQVWMDYLPVLWCIVCFTFEWYEIIGTHDEYKSLSIYAQTMCRAGYMFSRTFEHEK